MLEQQLQLKHTQLRNRLVMGSMHTGLEEAENGFQRMAAFYAERAAGGAALIVTGGVSPNEAGKLGLGPAEIVLLGLTLAVSIVTFVGTRTNSLQGVVHLAAFLTYIVLIFDA